jgi:hypothetical protein
MQTEPFVECDRSAPTPVEHSIEISAPAELVGHISQDYSVRYEWDPFPESISVVRGSMSPPPLGRKFSCDQSWAWRCSLSSSRSFIPTEPPSK